LGSREKYFPFVFIYELYYFCTSSLTVISIKKAFRIVLWSILSVCILVLVAYLLLELHPVQQKIKEFALQEIMKKTKSAVSIGNLRFHPFNRLQLEDLYAADLKNDTLLYAEKLDAGFNLFQLFRKRLVIHSIDIDNFVLHISKDSANAPFNFQFFIDAFASDTTPSADSSKLQLAINHISLKNGRLHYDVLSEPSLPSGLFDANHVDMRNLQLDADFHWKNLKDWNGSIAHLSFNEKSGFALEQLKFNVKNLNSRLQIGNFNILLPQSEGEIKEANFDYTGFAINEILSQSTYSLRFNFDKLYLPDISCFYPKLANYTEPAAFSGEAKGSLPEISLPQFEMNYGKQLQLTLNGGIKDYNAWETSAFTLNVEKSSIDLSMFKLPLNVDIVSLTGRFTGSLPDLKLDLASIGKQGNLALTGTGGYDVSSKNIRFNLGINSPGYNLKTLLSDSVFGNMAFQLTTQGTISGFTKINAKAGANIYQFNYKGYKYKNITAGAAYANDSVSIDLISNDPHLPLTLNGKAGLNKKNPFIQLYAKLDSVHPDVLHLLPQYPGLELSGRIHANINGFNPESMSASVAVDSFHWVSSSGKLNISSATLSYDAGADGQKQINLRSPLLNLRGKGNFSYEDIYQSVRKAFPTLFSSKYKIKKTVLDKENFDFVVAVRQANAIAHLLGIGTNIPDSAFFAGKFNQAGDSLNLNLSAFCIFTQSDTLQARVNLSNEQSRLIVQLTTRNRSNEYALEGNTGAKIEFVPNPSGTFPAMNIDINPGAITLNGTTFRIQPAQISIAKGRYEINNFALLHSASEYIKADGAISDNTADSIRINVNQFEIGTILSALKNKIPLSGTASGDITLSRMTKNPLIFTRNFTIDSLVFDGNPAGNLRLRSVWSSERQGLALRATWNHLGSPESTLSGFVLPQKDSLALTANIEEIPLKWMSGYFPDIFYGLDGTLGARIKVNGKPANPDLSGTVYLNNATAGIHPINTKYRVSDSIFLENNQILFRDFMVYDENKQSVKINGSIRHKQFSNLNPKLTLDFNQFLVLNNSKQTDSLFYGLIRVNGNLNVSLQNKDWLIQGRLSNGRANTFMMNVINSTVEAERYNWLTFVAPPKQDSIATLKEKTANGISDTSLPLRFQIALSVDPELSVGAIINPDTKDAAVVTGRGVINFSGALPNFSPRMQGNYTINDGRCTLSVINITRRTFTVQPGGKLIFQGDPMKTTFDLTAMYSLRAYLTSLDPSFASIATESKIPVNCVLTAGGNLDNMQLKYRIELPNQTDEIQRRLDGLIYTDEIKIKQIAYLLAFGAFTPVNANLTNSTSASIWTSLASSSITSQLNNLLSGVLRENWTIGTDLHSNDANFSDVDMDVNISTRLFNDRLTFNSTLGYHNNTTQTNNFTGDFNLEYKLTPRGNVLLQFYNVTNNQYYDKSKAPLTQGVGIVYKREGRTFRQLFRSFRARRR